MIVSNPNMVLERSSDPTRINLASDMSLAPFAKDVKNGNPVYSLTGFGRGIGNDGLGLTIGEGIGWMGYLGFAAAGLAAYYLFFKTSTAKQRRQALAKARSEYTSKVAAIKAKYRRF